MATSRARRIGLAVAGVVLLAALGLAVAPQSYTFEGVRVPCGNSLVLRNPPPPPGTDDSCDAVHVRRGFLAIGAAAAGLLIGGITLLATRRRRCDGPSLGLAGGDETGSREPRRPRPRPGAGAYSLPIPGDG